MFVCRSLLQAGNRVLFHPHSHRNIPISLCSHAIRAYVVSTQQSSALIDRYVEQLKSATTLHAIDTYYHNLIRTLKEQQKRGSYPTRQVLSKSQLSKVLWFHAKSGRPSDLQRIQEVLLDMPLVFGAEPTLDTHTTIIQGLILRGNIQTLRKWLENLPKHPPHVPPIPEHYHMVLESCVDMDGCSYKLARNMVLRMRQFGCTPTNETYKHLVRIRWKYFDRDGMDDPLRSVFTAMFEDMERENLPYDPSFGDLLHEEATNRNFSILGDQLQRLYMNKFRKGHASERVAMATLGSKLTQAIRGKKMEDAIALYNSWNDNQPPSPTIIQYLLQHSHQLSDLQLIEQEWGIHCDVSHWTILIANNIRAGKLDHAYSLYEASKTAGIAPDPTLVSPLIHSLCRARSCPPPEVNIDRALSIFQDLRTADPPFFQTTNEPGRAEQEIYASLLRGFAAAQSVSKYADVAKEIMDDMAARNYTPDDSEAVSAIIVLHMRSCQTAEEALEVFRDLRSSLDERGYAIVLNAFCKLKFGEKIKIPSLKAYFEIVKEMRLAGFETTAEVYTILLKQLADVATELRQFHDADAEEIRNKLVLTARRAHDLLTLDASLSPDAILWNQMMDTYQRLGCFADAYRVWDLLYVTGRFDEVSISIILDACGFAGAYSVAKQIITKLQRDKYQFTLHNWNTWLECLCRLGRLDEAVRILCKEMGNGGNVNPGVNSVEIVSKFARSSGKEADVLARVRLFWPDLLSSLS